MHLELPRKVKHWGVASYPHICVDTFYADVDCDGIAHLEVKYPNMNLEFRVLN